MFGNRRSRSGSPPPRRDGRSSFSPSVMSPRAGDRGGLIGKESGKDEFGRDLRPEDMEEEVEEKKGIRSPSLSSPQGNEDGGTSQGGSGMNPMSATNSGAAAATATAIGASNEVVMGSGDVSGLDTFDFASFNPTDPGSWVELGNAFEITNGYLPSQEELMQLVMGQMMSVASTMGGMASGGFTDMDGTNSNVLDQGQVREKGFAEDAYGSGLDTYAVDSSAAVGMEYANPQAQNSNAWASQDSLSSPQEDDQGKGTGTGQMKKIGDRWIFVRQ